MPCLPTVGSTPARSLSIKSNRTRYMLNDVNVKIRLERNKNAFALVAGGNDPDYKKTHRRGRRVREKGHIESDHSAGPCSRARKGEDQVPAASRRLQGALDIARRHDMSHADDNLYLGTRSKRVVLCCIDNDAYNGTYNKTPFHEKQRHINSGQITPTAFLHRRLRAKL